MKHLGQALLQLNFDKVEHNNGKSLLQHCANVADILLSFEASEVLVHAGYFHSIYGRQHTNFPPLDLSQRAYVAELIGPEAEELCYLNCVLRQDFFWNNFYTLEKDRQFHLVNRIDQSEIPVSFETLKNLLNLNFANMLEHFVFTQDSFRGKWWDLSGYLGSSQYLLPLAQARLQDIVRMQYAN